MDTLVVVVAVAAVAMTCFSVALANLIPDEYDHRGAPRLAPARSRAMRVRQ